MKRVLAALVVLGLFGSSRLAHANLLTNGNLDRGHAVEVVPGFFLPQPNDWIAVGHKSASGPYNDELSSEPWAGPAPTPVTADNLLNAPFPDGCGNTATDGDCGVFFKAFTGTTGDAMTADLYQDVAGSAGTKYVLTGWAGAEANMDAADAVFALDFYSGLGVPLGSVTADLFALGLFTANAQPFNYKQFSVVGIAPAGTAVVRARVSLIDGVQNPQGGGQAFVVDDFTLDTAQVPEPASGALVGLGLAYLARRRGRRS
jgi:hypothetical protein